MARIGEQSIAQGGSLSSQLTHHEPQRADPIRLAQVNEWRYRQDLKQDN